MKKILLTILCFYSLHVFGQLTGGTLLPTGKYQQFNRSAIATGKKLLDGKYSYYDTVNFVSRPFTSVAEANAFLPVSNRGYGQTVFINTGGTINTGGPTTVNGITYATGEIIGGNNDEYYYRNNTANVGLVIKNAGTSGGISNFESTLNWYRPETYGAVADGVTDDGPAINTMMAALPASGAVVYFGAKAYMINTQVVVNKHVTFMGAGASEPDYFGPNKTRILTTSPTINIFRTITNGITFKDIGFYNRTTGIVSAGAAIRVDSGGLGLHFEGLAVSGFYDGIYFYDGGEWSMQDCQIQSNQNGRYCVYVSRVNTPDGGDQSISDSWFFNGGQAGIKYISGGGLKISNSKFNQSRGYIGGIYQVITGKVAIDVNITDNTSDLVLTGNSIEGYAESAIRIRSNGLFTNVNIGNNQISSAGAINTMPVVDISNIRNLSMVGNTFHKNDGNDTAIKIVSVNGAEVKSNPLFGYTMPVAIYTSGCTNCKIQSNYDLETGNGGGQVITGANNASGYLVLSSTSSNNKGWIFFGDASTGYYEPTKQLAIGATGTITPGEKLKVHGLIVSDTLGYKFPDGSIQTSANAGISLSTPNNFTNTNSFPKIISAYSPTTGNAVFGNLNIQSINSGSSIFSKNLTYDGANYRFIENGYGMLQGYFDNNIYYFSTPSTGTAGALAGLNTPLVIKPVGIDVTGTGNFSSQISVNKNGSHTIGNGPIIGLANATQSRAYYMQLNANQGMDFWAFDTTTATFRRTMTLGNNWGVGYPANFSHGLLKDSSFVDKHYVDSIIGTSGTGGNVYLGNANNFTQNNKFPSVTLTSGPSNDISLASLLSYTNPAGNRAFYSFFDGGRGLSFAHYDTTTGQLPVTVRFGYNGFAGYDATSYNSGALTAYSFAPKSYVDSLRAAGGGGTGGGTVTSVSATVPSGFSATISNATTTPNIAISAAFAANQLLIGNGTGIGSVSAGVNGTYLKMVAGIPTWTSDTSLIATNGTLDYSNGVLGISTTAAGAALDKSITITTAAYTVAPGIHMVICDNSAGTTTITLPTTFPVDYKVTIKNFQASNNVTSTPVRSGDGNLLTGNAAVTWQWSGAVWFGVSKY